MNVQKVVLLAVLVSLLLPQMPTFAQSELPVDMLTKKEVYMGILSCLMKNPNTSIWIDQTKNLVAFFWPDAVKMNAVVVDLRTKGILPAIGAVEMFSQQISFGEYNDLPEWMRSIGYKKLPPYLVPMVIRDRIKEWIALMATNGRITIVVVPLQWFLRPTGFETTKY